MKKDIEISNECNLYDILEVAKKIGLNEADISLYGKYKAKITNEALMRIENNDNGKLILVTAINPTPLGEGKTTTTIGLGDALNKIGKKAVVALREPSLGPVFGVKGGATGGGYSQIVPMEDINLHFNGDFHAIELANNLMCAALDNHIFQGNELNIDPNKVLIKRAVDMNDRILREIEIGINPKNGIKRLDGFDITVASEVMAIFCLSKDIFDLKERLGNIIVAYSKDNKEIYAKDLEVNGAMAVLLKNAILPNIVQTLEKNVALVHGGPFANIAHGCNSIIATKTALKLGEYVVTEAGFGADLGAEKFLDIKCKNTNIYPSAIVIVATIRALKYNGMMPKDELEIENVEYLKKGLPNLQKHIENMKKYNIPVVVALNKFDSDSNKEIEVVKQFCKDNNVEFEVNTSYRDGGNGATELAKLIVKIISNYEIRNVNKNPFYNDDDEIKEKIEKVAKNVYGAGSVKFSKEAAEKMELLKNTEASQFPICMAKTQMSLSDNSKLLGKPEGFEFNVKDIKLANGAGFIIVYSGSILTMPGLSKDAAYKKIDINDEGKIIGLF